MSQTLNRTRFRRLAETRLQDARTLLVHRRFSAAYYLAGYTVECALKACIAKKTRRYDFPDKDRVQKSYSHNLKQLSEQAGLSIELERLGDQRFADYWDVVKDWSEESRYTVVKERMARQIVRAISDPRHGVLRWLRAHW
ncbi:MAG: HEPN domain-containing protein [Planctomycetes bacterium]|nr:HEPN domain-containing protein [Planctomycetota bacterium]